MEEARKLENYTILESLYLGDREIVLGMDKDEAMPYMVCNCTYNNAFGVPWPSDAVATDDYLEALEFYTDRVREQIEKVRSELAKFPFDLTPFTAEDCLPENRDGSIIGKVIVIKTESLRLEYQHSAYQLVYAEGGHGASGGRGNAVFGTCLGTGEKGRWERFNVLGEIRPDRIPDWAQEKLEDLIRRNQERQKVSER